METLYYHGDIITMEDSCRQVEAVLVRDGRIAFAGSLSEAQEQASGECMRIDLEGRTMLPAFLDGHGHLSMTTQYVAMADLSSAASFEDVAGLLRNFIETHQPQPGEWIVGYAYDHNFLKEQTYPDRKVLDQVSTEHPVVIWHASTHMCVVNSLLLSKLNITAATPQPEGGVIGRYAGTEEPDGYLEEMATTPVRELQGQLPIDYAGQVYEAQMKYIQNGILTIQEGASDHVLVKIFRQLAEEGRLIADVVAYPCFGFGAGVGDAMEVHQDCINHYVNRFKIGGYKLLLDGSPQGKSAWLTEPYEGEQDGYRGYPWMKDAEVEKLVETALDARLQLLTHCNGDAAADQLLNAYEKVLERKKDPSLQNLRPVMIHCQTVREDQLDRMAAIGMLPSIFVAHTNYWGDVHLRNLGQRRAERISPVYSAYNRKMKYNFHTDTPVVQPLMFHTIWCAVNRITRNGAKLGPAQCVDVYDALKGITIHAAYAYGEEAEKGSIQAGKRADLIIVDANPLTIDPMRLKDIQVMETIREGETVYRK